MGCGGSKDVAEDQPHKDNKDAADAKQEHLLPKPERQSFSKSNSKSAVARARARTGRAEGDLSRVLQTKNKIHTVEKVERSPQQQIRKHRDREDPSQSVSLSEKEKKVDSKGSFEKKDAKQQGKIEKKEEKSDDKRRSQSQNQADKKSPSPTPAKKEDKKTADAESTKSKPGIASTGSSPSPGKNLKESDSLTASPLIQAKSAPPSDTPQPRKSTALPAKPASSSSKRPSLSGSQNDAASSKAEQIKKMKEDEERKQKDTANEMEQLRLAKVKQIQEKISKETPSEQEQKAVEEARQAQLKKKAEEIRLEEEARNKKREEELAKVRQAEQESEKKRNQDREVLKKKIESGKALSVYEEQVAKNLGVLQPESPTSPQPEGVTHRRHSSMMTDKPQVRKLSHALSSNEDLANVVKHLEKAQEQKNEAMKTLATIQPILDDLNKQDKAMKEFMFSNSPFFAQWSSRTPEKDENSINLARAVGAHPYLSNVEMYSSALDDQFAVAFATAISKGNMTCLEKLHLESNHFTGKGMSAILQALSDPDKVPNLRTIKLSNQKFQIDTATETAALDMLRSNPKITKLTVDWKKPIDAAECTRLLAKNANLNRRNSSSQSGNSRRDSGEVKASPRSQS